MQRIVRLTNGSSLTGRCAVFQVAKAVSHSLNNCVNCLPGQKDVDMALRSIGEASKKLLVDIVSQTFTLGFLDILRICIDTRTAVLTTYIIDFCYENYAVP